MQPEWKAQFQEYQMHLQKFKMRIQGQGQGRPREEVAGLDRYRPKWQPVCRSLSAR